MPSSTTTAIEGTGISTSTTTVTVAGPSTSTTTAPALEPATGTDVETLLAEIDAELAGLTELMDQAAASLAAEEGEIIP